MDIVEFYKLETVGEMLGTLVPKEPPERLIPIVERYFLSFVGRSFTATSMFANVKYTVFRFVGDEMDILINSLLVYKEPTTGIALKHHRDVIQVIVDDHLLQMALQYFNEYALPKKRLFYYHKEFGNLKIKKLL
jgi:hypothetical protein